jgi:hypothetical protein
VAAWRFEVCNRDGTNVEPIVKARNRTVSIPLNGLPVATFTIRIDDPRATRVLALDGLLLKVYRNNVLVFCGPLTTAEEASSGRGASITVGAAGVWWRLGKRLTGKAVDGAGRGVGYTEGTPLAPVNKSVLVQHLIENANAESDTGVRIGTVTSAGSSYIGPWYFKVTAEAVAEIVATLDGPDIELVPSEPTVDGAGVKLGTLNIVPNLSTNRSSGANSVDWEYGRGKRNVASYRRLRTLDGLLNKAWSIPTGFPDAHDVGTAPIANSSDTSASLALHGLLEAIVSDDLGVDSFRQTLADEHARIRKQARETILFDPHPARSPNYPTDFKVGDLVAARAAIGGVSRFDVVMRVYGVAFTIPEQGPERLELVLVNDQ